VPVAIAGVFLSLLGSDQAIDGRNVDGAEVEQLGLIEVMGEPCEK